MDQSSAAVVEAPTPTPTATPAIANDKEITPERKALVTWWNEQIKKAREEDKIKKAFERMQKCMKLAAKGSLDDDWVAADKYVLPIITRHINLAVSTLYARNPNVVAKRRKKMLFRLWDGQQQTAMAAFQAAQAGDMTQLPLLQDIQQGQQYLALLDKMGKTMEICWQHFMDQQEYNYKARLKSAVRRAKVNGVAYAVLDYQRVMQPRPDQDARIADITSKIVNIQYQIKEQSEGDTDDEEDKRMLDQLQLNLKDMQSNPDVIAEEGPVISFPKSTSILIDPACNDLRTLTGARWLSQIFPVTEEMIEKLYPAIDLDEDAGGATEYVEPGKSKDSKKVKRYALHKIWDRENQQVMFLLEGYKDFAKEPATPDVKIYPFFPVYPLVFNEIESEDELYPYSDVWLIRHSQDELNRSRQGIRDHRRANVPFYAVAKGALEQTDHDKLATHGAHEVVEFNALQVGGDINKVLQRPMLNQIDPEQYDIKGHIDDIMRSVGTQSADMGPTTGATATESSIAENSRQSSQADNVDDLDEWLTRISQAGGKLMLTELSKERAIEIAGPGASWPDMPETRQQVADDLYLDIEAGSSGRPNRAAELADMERAAPTILQIPGINPVPFAKKYLQVLNIDLEEGVVEGMPSIQAINAMMSAAARGAPPGMPPGAPPPAGPPPPAHSPAPAAQGHMGAHNGPMSPHPVGPMAAHPAPGIGNAPMTHQV